MGRTNGKLCKFLKDGLMDGSFINLKWEDIDSHIFSIKIPRHDENKDLREYERILEEWYIINKRKDQYPGYSGAKTVIQAAMKKSPFLLSLKSNDNKRWYKFATKAEEQEKRRLQKLKSSRHIRDPVVDQHVPEEHEVSLPDDPNFLPELMYSPSPPSSPSSGYQSDEIDENVKVDEGLADLDNLFNNPEYFINALKDIGLDSGAISLNDIMEDSADAVPEDYVKSNDAQYMQPVNENNFKPVEELVATEIHSPRILGTYWRCTKKVVIDSTLLLICEKQVIKDGIQGFAPGQIDLNNALEPGASYDLKNMIELDGKCFLFLSRNN